MEMNTSFVPIFFYIRYALFIRNRRAIHVILQIEAIPLVLRYRV
jgi:hypothetical protein